MDLSPSSSSPHISNPYPFLSLCSSSLEEMETELRRLQSSHSFKKSLSNVSTDSDKDLIKYTSLKDILSADSASRSLIFAYPSFDGLSSSSILLRNNLLKHAASAYLQSTAMLTNRDQNWLARMWTWSERQRELLGCWWRDYVRDPFAVCVRFIVRSVRAMLASVRGSWSGCGHNHGYGCIRA